MRPCLVIILGCIGLAAATAGFAAGASEVVLAEVSAAMAKGEYRQADRLAGEAMAEPGLTALARDRLLVARGLARQADGRNIEALADFTEGLSGSALSPAERARALYDRGVALDSMNKWDDALGDYDGALKLDARASYALNNRANVYRRQGRFDLAKRDYRAALAAGGSAEYPNFGLGQIAEAEGDVSGARAFYARALGANPQYALAQDRLTALGTADTAPVDPGIVTLRPPSAFAPAPPGAIVLHPPAVRPAGNTAPTRRERFAEVAPADAAPGQGAPLRPAIVERSAGSVAEPQAQLGAWRSRQEAEAAWKDLKPRTGGILAGLAPIIVTAEISGKGRYYRLRVPAAGGASQFCALLASKGVTCIPARD